MRIVIEKVISIAFILLMVRCFGAFNVSGTSWDDLSSFKKVAESFGAEVIQTNFVDLSRLHPEDVICLIHPEKIQGKVFDYLRKGGKILLMVEYGDGRELLKPLNVYCSRSYGASIREARVVGDKSFILTDIPAQIERFTPDFSVFAYFARSPQILAIRGRYMSGKIVIIADSSVFINGSMDSPFASAQRRFLRRTLKYLGSKRKLYVMSGMVVFANEYKGNLNSYISLLNQRINRWVNFLVGRLKTMDRRYLELAILLLAMLCMATLARSVVERGTLQDILKKVERVTSFGLKVKRKKNVYNEELKYVSKSIMSDAGIEEKGRRLKETAKALSDQTGISFRKARRILVAFARYVNVSPWYSLSTFEHLRYRVPFAYYSADERVFRKVFRRVWRCGLWKNQKFQNS